MAETLEKALFPAQISQAKNLVKTV